MRRPPHIPFRDPAEAREFHLWLARRGHASRLTEDGQGPVVEALLVRDQTVWNEEQREWLTERAREAREAQSR